MNIRLEYNQKLPIYQQIVRAVKNGIISGEIQAGELLPSIRSLARDLEVSVITTKRAYEELERAGLIYSVQGLGFFVKEPDVGKLREQLLLKLEDQMEQLLAEGEKLGLTLEDMLEMMRLCQEERKE